MHESRRYIPKPRRRVKTIVCQHTAKEYIGPAVRADFRRLYPANAKTPTCCPSDDNRTKVTNSVTSARSLWWHVGPYFWPADLTRTANPNIVSINEKVEQQLETATTTYTKLGNSNLDRVCMVTDRNRCSMDALDMELMPVPYSSYGPGSPLCNRCI